MHINLSAEFIISTFVALTSAIGLLFVGLQTRFASKLARAQFLDKLSMDVDENIDIEVDLEQNGELYELRSTCNQETRRKIIKFLSFFDRIAHLYKLGFVDIKIIDAMFAYRFFILVHNPNVQEFELLNQKTRHFWISIFALHKVWYAYRKRNGQPLLREEHAQRLFDDSVYQKSKLL